MIPIPNHVTTEITAMPEVVAALLRPTTDEEKQQAREVNERMAEWDRKNGRTEGRVEPVPTQTLDFGLVVPPPENIEEGNCSGMGSAHPDGVICWYEWQVANWGTKWNGYDWSVTEPGTDGYVTLRFDTAWSHPFPVMVALSQQHKEDFMHVKFADEDLGSNLGEYDLLGGAPRNEHVPETEDERLDFAAQLKYGMTGAEIRAEWAEDEDPDEDVTDAEVASTEVATIPS